METLTHVLWIGGPPGSGKSTVARRIARRHGLRWYNSDAYSWEHRERAARAGVPAAIQFESMTREQRRALPVEDRLAMALQRERGPMTIDDLCALPLSPLIIAEGTQITPSIIPPGSQALWLMLSPHIQRVRLEQRHKPRPAPELYLRMGQMIIAEVNQAGASDLVVDDLSIDETVAAVEKYFAVPLAQGPKTHSTQERRELLRYANRADVERYTAFYARPWNTSDIATAIHPFACECAQPDCDALVDLAIPHFPAPPDDTSPPLLAPGHKSR